MVFRSTRVYLRSMAVYWSGFGLVTMFAPRVMDLFQSNAGLVANTPFSDHVWFHGGLDIMALSVVLLALSLQPPQPHVLRAVGVAAMMPAIAISASLVSTDYWNPLFAVAAAGCFAFGVWGFVLSMAPAASAEGAAPFAP